MARPVELTTFEQMADQHRAAGAYELASLARCLARGRGNHFEAYSIAKATRATSRVIETLEKASIPAGGGSACPLWLERVGASGEQEEDGGKAVQAGKAQAAALSHFALLSSPP